MSKHYEVRRERVSATSVRVHCACGAWDYEYPQLWTLRKRLLRSLRWPSIFRDFLRATGDWREAFTLTHAWIWRGPR